MIRFGPAGIGSIKDAVNRLKEYEKKGIKAAEIPFTYGVYMKQEKHSKEIREIKEQAEKSDINLSIHAPYWINLNSREKKKIDESKKRILNSCKIGNLIGAEKIVFHPGYYSGMSEEETYKNIKKAILEIKQEIRKNNWKVELCPETTGKVNVFGKESEILNLVKETKCSFTLDFAHLKARHQGEISYKEIFSKVSLFQKLHCHFSGIEWGEKGEKRHLVADEKEIKELLSVLPKNKKITIISESPNPIEDSVKAIKIYKKLV